MTHIHRLTRATALAAGLAALALPALAEPLFWSTQAKPVEETQKMRDQVLSGFPGGVDYQPSDEGPWQTRVEAERTAGTGTIAVLGGRPGDAGAWQAGDGGAEVYPLDAGHLSDGGEPQGA